MNAQTDLLQAEMEVSPRVQNAIVVHHILQVVSTVVAIIIYGAACQPFFKMPLPFLILAIFPTLLFIIFWISSKCNYKDLRLILVHFNPFLSTLWFLAFLAFCIIFSLLLAGIFAIITGFLSLSSAIFATYGIWKSARKIVLSARRAKCEDNDVLGSIPSTVESPDTYTNTNVIRLSQADYIHAI